MFGRPAQVLGAAAAAGACGVYFSEDWQRRLTVWLGGSLCLWTA